MPPEARESIGREVRVSVDRPLGSQHPEHANLIYEVNYGYLEGIRAADGEWQDVYILGVHEHLTSFTGRVCAVIHRRDDVETKWVVVRAGARFSLEEIELQTHFQEKFYDTWIEL